MDLISVIIPVYNVRPYIKKCLDSVACQTYGNLEVLLIDDGSTDGSGEVCDEYAAKDSRFRAFHKENGGLSSALNVGLGAFTGCYLGFVDSDDWIEPGMFETLHDAAKRSGADISVAGYFKDTGARSVPMSNRAAIPEGAIGARDMLLYPLMRDHYMAFAAYVWNKLYAADALRPSGIGFDDGIKYGMDVLFYMSLVSSKKCTGIYTDRPLYHYLQRGTAISKIKSVSVKSDILAVYKRVEGLLEEHGYSCIAFWARGFYCYHAGVIAEIAHGNNDKEVLCAMQREIEMHLGDYIETNAEFPEKQERMRRLLDLEVA